MSIRWLLTINQFDSMVIGPVMLGEFGSQVQKKYIRKVNILVGDLYKSLLGNQAGNLRPTGRMIIELKWEETG